MLPPSYHTTKPLTLWFLNHDIDTDEARRQVLEFKRQGLGGFFMHWINGAAPYMGGRWLDSVGELIEMAAETGLEAWLYDEAWCPSCFAGGRILARRPNLRARTLWHQICDVEPGGTASVDFDLMNPLAVFAAPLANGVPDMARAERLDGLLGTAVLDFAPPYRNKDGYYPHVKPLEHWRASGNGFRWLLRWKAPASASWRVYVFCERLMDAGSRAWIDVLNPESIQCFLEETHEKYAARFKDYFGTVIPGVMTDEYKYLPMPWTAALPAQYAARHSENLIDCLPALVDPRVKNCSQVRIKYHRLVSDLFRQSYTVPMAAWCHQHNLFLTGHISPEEDLSGEISNTGSIAAHLKHFDMPGTDLIMQAVGDRERPALNLGPRMASSVARQQGRGRSFVEVGACCDEALSLEQLKYLCDWLMVNGINMINFHGASYSLKGTRKYTTGQTLSIYNNLWRHFDTLSKYLEETCALLVEYPPARRVALLKPLSAARALYQSDAGERLDEALVAASWQLLKNHLDFDLLDEDGADGWRIEDGRLHVGEVVYDSVIVPEGAAELAGLTAKAVPPCVAISGAEAENVLAYAGYNQAGEKLGFVLNTLDREVTVEIESVGVTLAAWESRLFKGAPQAAKPSNELAIAGPWQVKAERMNHVPLLGPSDKITVEDATVAFLVCESEQLRPSLRVDGKTPRWEDAETAAFFDGDNLLIPVGELFGDGEHVVTFEGGDDLPTVLLAGDFAAFPQGAHEHVLRRTPDTATAVDRVEAGYPFLRGALVFSTSFVLDKTVDSAQLRLPGRKGAVAVELDSRELGVVAWRPDVIAVGTLAAGRHELTLRVVGDGIGLQREGFFAAGLEDCPRINVTVHVENP